MHRFRRLLTWLVIVLGLLGVLVGPAAAEAPVRLPDQLTDSAGVLGSRANDVQNAIDGLYSADKERLWVVFVDTFSGQTSSAWAQQTFTMSELGSSDVLLAVATQDRSVQFLSTSDFAQGGKLDGIRTDDIEPKLANKDWAGAAIAAADGLKSAAGGSSSSSSGLLWLIVVVVVAVIAIVIWTRARRRRTAAGDSSASAPGGTTPAGPPPEPYEQLSARSVQALIDTDNAVRTSENQLKLAEQTFGAPAVADFRSAYDQAHTSLAAAFQLRQQIDDEQPEDEATRRQWMGEILQRCDQAVRSLAAQSERFDELLDIKTRLPAVLSALPGQIDAQAARIPSGQATLTRIRQTYADSAAATVAGNDEAAGQRLDLARSALGEATAATDPTTGAVAARTADEAVDQAKTLLDAIDKLDADLSAAAAGLQAARQPVEAELTAARSAFAQGSTGTDAAALQQRLDQVQAALAAAAGPAGQRDPILARQRIREADEALDGILADTRTAQQSQQKAAASLADAVNAAQATIDRASDYVNARRGTVGSTARTRLAEAERHLANATSTSDPAVGLAEARQAQSQATEAISLAQDDYTGFGGPGGYGGGYGYSRRGGGFGTNLGGAVVGGILGGLLSDAGQHRGGGWGGFGGGGFGGGGFGGGGFGGGGFGGGGGFSGGGGGFGDGGGGGGFSGGGGRF